MKRSGRFAGAAVALVLLSSCGEPGGNPPERAAATPAVEVATPPTASELLALDRQATEAYFGGDTVFFEGLLSDAFVTLAPDGARMDKAATIGMIAGVRCDVEEGWALDEPRISTIDDDTYVLTYRGSFEGSCGASGRVEKIPSPVRAATVWARRGESWQAAFHGENPILDPRAASVPSPEPEVAEGSPGRDDAAVPAVASVAPVVHPETAAMMAVEAAVWEAWKDQDARALGDLTARSLAFVDIFGNVTSGKAETIDFWHGHQCDVRSTRVVEGAATPISATVALLTFQGVLEGTCGGQEFPLIHGTSVYAKEGGAWKLAFTLNHLVRSR